MTEPGAQADSRAALLARVGEEHYQYAKRYADSAPFNPEQEKDRADYNVWNLDYESDPDKESEFQNSVGGLDFSSAGPMTDSGDGAESGDPAPDSGAE